MVRTIGGGLLGGLAIYIIGFLFWGTPFSALAFSRAEGQDSANLQAALAHGLSPTGTGVYIIPDPATAEGTILYGKGPVAQVFYNNSGFPVTDGSSLIAGLILSLAVGVLFAFTLRLIAGNFALRARISVLLALTAVLWAHISQAVFMHAPWGYILYLAFSDFVSLAVAGLIAAKVMDWKTSEATDATTMH